MQAFVVRRLITLIPVMLLVSVVAFSIILLLPGDPALVMLGDANAQNKELYQQFRKSLGLDEPLPVQYMNWLARAVQGDLGTSVRTTKTVTELISGSIVPTTVLAVFALLLALLVSIPAGVVSAMRPNTIGDTIATIVSLTGAAVPPFLLGMLLLFVFSLWAGLLPAGGYVPPDRDLGRSLLLMLMPAVTLATGSAAVLTRQVRSSMVEVLQQDYITTARSKGLTQGVVLWRHALKNSMIPVLTVIGNQVGRLLGGAVVIETVFSIPGLGRLAVTSIFARDFPVVQGVVLVMAIAVLAVNFVTDILYGYVDPRIRYS